MRTNMRYDGIPFRPVTVAKVSDRPRLVILTDVSLSVRATARFTLHLVHGLHAGDQLSIRVADLGLLDAMMDRLRVSPPEAFGGSAVETVTDLAEGSGHLPPTEGLLYLTKDLSRVIIRPSGTEPKLKCYLEVIRSVGSAAELPAARQEARAALDGVLADVREPREWAISDLGDSVKIPLGTLPESLEKLSKDDEIVVYCRTGGRSGNAVAFLLEHGFEKVRNLAGGINRWADRIDKSLPRY